MLRVLLIASAFLTAAWFALGVRQARDVAAATAIVDSGRHLSPLEARHAGSVLSAAGLINPDSSVDLLRAQLDRDQGDFRAARRVVERVVTREPDNVEAWYALALSARGSPRAWARALGDVMRLAPPPR